MVIFKARKIYYPIQGVEYLNELIQRSQPKGWMDEVLIKKWLIERHVIRPACTEIKLPFLCTITQVPSS